MLQSAINARHTVTYTHHNLFALEGSTHRYTPEKIILVLVRNYREGRVTALENGSLSLVYNEGGRMELLFSTQTTVHDLCDLLGISDLPTYLRSKLS